MATADMVTEAKAEAGAWMAADMTEAAIEAAMEPAIVVAREAAATDEAKVVHLVTAEEHPTH